MFGSHEQRMIDAFTTQFESDGRQGYLYRYSGRGRGIPVSATERDAFVDAYRSGNRRNLIVTAMGACLAIVSGVALEMAFHLVDRPLGNVALGGPIAILIASIAATAMRSYNAPRRALAGRAGVGEDRSRETAKAIAVARQSWGQIFGAIAPVFGIFAVQAMKYDVLHGWYRLWWLLPALGAFGGGYAAIRKWRSAAG